MSNEIKSKVQGRPNAKAADRNQKQGTALKPTKAEKKAGCCWSFTTKLFNSKFLYKNKSNSSLFLGTLFFSTYWSLFILFNH